MTVLLIVLALLFLPIAIMPLPIAARIVFGLCSVFCIFLAVVLAKRRLILDERGVTAKGAFGAKHVAWDEVDHYTFWSMNQNAAYVAGAQGGVVGALVAVAVVAAVRAARSSGKQSNRRFNQGRLTLVTKAGAKLVIDARYADVIAALDYAFTELHARLRGKPQDFSPFTLGETELRHAKKGAIGLPDIQHVGCGGARITIKKRDKRLAWAGAHMKSIKNVMLFLETVAEKGLVINANAEVFMPPTVLDKLRASASRQAAMPQARVVDRR
ncbi:MAG: hypothetical protein HOV81_00880 [Kofleriaceae bacterium]|nr:hypothetical protein [Kofleriaceae bacterium]